MQQSKTWSIVAIAKRVIVKLKIIDTTFVNAEWIHVPVALGASRSNHFITKLKNQKKLKRIKTRKITFKTTDQSIKEQNGKLKQ